MIQRHQEGFCISQSVSYGALVYAAGQVANDRKGGIEAQPADVIAKIDGLPAEAGANRSKLQVVKDVLPTIIDLEAMNSVYDN